MIVKDDRVVLIKRTRDGEVYYVFPGGGIEAGETAETAAEREAFEELGVRVSIRELLKEVEYNGTQSFFLAEVIEGEIGTGAGEEFTDPARTRGKYEVVWMSVDRLDGIDVRPREVAEAVLVPVTHRNLSNS
ncbi:NUDIX hydrolase [Alteribacter keqinensis]|uniref:NUDIX hydrolase n=1 Tax=Alteribacter keqinensis TaxID=2483800 RepID=UPI002017AF59|nr:NUDIX domain-containing protein [Alteribacter keqinensis]